MIELNGDTQDGSDRSESVELPRSEKSKLRLSQEKRGGAAMPIIL